MKKFLFLTVAVGMTLSLASCKKDYVCTCTYNDGSANQTIEVPINNAKKSDAEDACAASESVYKVIDANASCSLQ
jgi:hypothetical protein